MRQLTKSGFRVDFSAHWLPVDIDRDQGGALLEEAYGLATTSELPAAAEGCNHCANLSRITELLEGIKEPLTDTRQSNCLTQPERARLHARRVYLKSHLETAITDLQDAFENARQDDPWSVMGLWDFGDDKSFT